MTPLVPPVFTLIRAPERAAVAALAAATALTRNALLAAHPRLACEPTENPLDRAVRRILRRLARLDRDLDLYVQADDSLATPSDDDIF
jgi:hypothetical protein